MAANEYTERIDRINDQIADVDARNQTAHAGLRAEEARMADWMRNYQGPGHSSEADSAILSAQQGIDRWTTEIQVCDALRRDLLGQLQAAKQDLDAYNKAVAKAAAEGLTGKAAEDRAAALLWQSKAKTGLMVAAGLVTLTIACIAFYLWYKKRLKKA